MTDFADNIGNWFKGGFDLYKNNMAVFILATLIALILTAVTFGILGGPMYAGLVYIALKLHDREQPAPTAGDVFSGFKYFLNSFLFFIVWGIILFIAGSILGYIPCLGLILVICLSLAAGAFLMFGIFLIVDKEMAFWPASMASIEKVKESFFPFLGLSVVAGVIGQIGAVACVIGIILTMPIYICTLTVTYRDTFGDNKSSAQETPAGPVPGGSE